MENVFIQFRAKFVEDAQELITGLEKVLLELENSQQNTDLIDEVFRVMHTLKGVSSMYGFDNISKYTHKLETIYALIREGQLALSKEIFDITLASVDHITNLLNDIDFTNENNKITHEKLISRISKIIETKPETTSASSSESKIPERFISSISDENKKTYYIMFRPEENFFKRGINIVNIFKELSALGQFHIFKHTASANYEDDTWGIFLSTSSSYDDIEDVFLFVSDNCRILKMADDNLFNQDSTSQIDSSKLSIIEDISEDFTEISSVEDVTHQKKNDNIKSPAKTPETEKNKENTEIAVQKKENQQSTQISVSPKENKQSTTEPLHPAVSNTSHSQGKNISTRISVASDKLDYLMYLVSELVTTNAQLNLAYKENTKTLLESSIEKIEKLSKQFRDNALSLRLIPINDIVIRFQRLIRDLSQTLNKEVQFITQGVETELDKSIIDALVEPIMHIIRNCIDHGIETPDSRIAQGKTRSGVIKFIAFHSGTNVFIRIEDDGGGINTEKVLKKAIEKGFVPPDIKLNKKEIFNLIFLPGFSTAESLTQVSGRGVGMDVVKRKVHEVRGDIDIDSEVGLGTSFTIKLSQTVSIIDTLLVLSEDTHFMIPVSDIENCDRVVNNHELKSTNRVIEYQKALIPLIHLRNEFELGGEDPEIQKVIFINKNDNHIAIVVDKILGEHQAVLKPMGRVFKNQQFLLGASIMGDGNMALMLDTNKLMDEVFTEIKAISA